MAQPVSAQALSSATTLSSRTSGSFVFPCHDGQQAALPRLQSGLPPGQILRAVVDLGDALLDVPDDDLSHLVADPGVRQPDAHGSAEVVGRPVAQLFGLHAQSLGRTLDRLRSGPAARRLAGATLEDVARARRVAALPEPL